MKTSGIIILICLLAFFSVSGQTYFSEKTDSFQKELLKPRYKSFENPLKLYDRFPDQRFQFHRPENFGNNTTPEMAFKRVPGQKIYISPLDRMPVYVPDFQSQMPIMKPDPGIKYHLLIKRIGKDD